MCFYFKEGEQVQVGANLKIGMRTGSDPSLYVNTGDFLTQLIGIPSHLV